MSTTFFLRRELLWSLLVLLGACTDKYLPDVISAPQSFLVVDGFLNTQGMTTIKLTRTFAVASKEKPPVETRATLAIEEQAGPRFALQETDKGTYASANLALSPGKNYRLLITTLAGQQYASDFVPAKITPPIDSVSWRIDAEGVKVYVSAHDDTKATQYYRWKLEETWEIVPPYSPQLEWANGNLRTIAVPFPRICWGTEKSADIKLEKTTNLSQDLVSDYVLRAYPKANERLRHRYSMLVRQYAQTQEEYSYWGLMRKNTEDIGTLFDPLPVQLTGNVHCLTDAAEVALGYVGAYSERQQRIFISRNDLPFDWDISTGYDSCIPDTVKDKDIRKVFSYPGNIPLYDVPGGILGTSRDCVDCRLRGTTVKPSFW
jgi:hypothetical protein